jgi:hypothetical protein
VGLSPTGGVGAKVDRCSGIGRLDDGAGSAAAVQLLEPARHLQHPDHRSEPTGIDWSGWRTELPFTKANLPVLTLDGVSACVESFNIDFGLQVSRRNLPGCQQSILTGYEITGGMKIVAPTVADKDWYAKVESHAGLSTVALALQYGATAGDIILLASSEIQISNLTEEESGDGDLAFNFELSFLDQPVITFQ